MPRRRSRPELVLREEKQAEIVAALVLLGADEVAKSVARCWHERLFGDPAQHRYRCRSVSCLFCRNRASLSAWWRAYSRWSDEEGAQSYFTQPVGDYLDDMPKFRKRLRNLRDRLARINWQFSSLAFAGITNGENILVIVSHPGLTREEVQRRLRALHPMLVLADVPIAPSIELSPAKLALLGWLRRGLQPARFVVLPRRER